MGFNKGDIVRLKAGQEKHNRDFYGIDLEVVKDERGTNNHERLVHVRKVGSDPTNWQNSTEFFDWRLEKVVRRREGEKIAFEDIKIGDTIHTTWQNDDLKLMREGVVASFTSLGSIKTAGNRHIGINGQKEDTYTLVKAAPEVDTLLEKIKDTEIGGVVQFHLATTRFAHKGVFGWDIYGAGGVVTKSSAELATMLRPLEGSVALKWLS